MKKFEDYFTEEAIITYLCKLRVKVANSRNKKHLLHLLTSSEKFNYHVSDKKKYHEANTEESNDFIKYQSEFLNELNKLLPPRKKWISLGEKSRKNKKTRQPISSSDRNLFSLLKTIKFYQKKSPAEPWLLNLNKFVSEIQENVFSNTYTVRTPLVFPKPKDKKSLKDKNKCRPISLFYLKDRIILSLTNKFLTNVLDNYFEDCSFAFRSKKDKNTGIIITHHDCVREVVKYRRNHENKALYVVECDMEKFYDSVNHKIIKQLFCDLITKVKLDFPYLNLDYPSHIFNEFLNCYAFNHNVLPLNQTTLYWDKYKIPNGEFGWVDKQFKKLDYYDNIEEERIGIPQGGALSGLIANIVLNIADKNVLKTNVFYTRFCDDMLIIHPDKDECLKAKNIYIDSLKELKLVPHTFCEDLIVERAKKKKKLPVNTLKPFWNEKSKGPYKWDKIDAGGFPWIGFVGYEINYLGDLRVRKKSLEKELLKQHEVINIIKKTIKNGTRKTIGSISESAIHRLVGMSVGRVNLRNYEVVENDLCWKNGFKELSENKHTVLQIKQLDRNRNKLYYDFVKELKTFGVKQDENDDSSSSKPRQVIHFNKPFSYYFQVLERKRLAE